MDKQHLTTCSHEDGYTTVSRLVDMYDLWYQARASDEDLLRQLNEAKESSQTACTNCKRRINTWIRIVYGALIKNEDDRWEFIVQ